MCHRLQYSLFFIKDAFDHNQAKVEMRRENTQRIEEANTYFKMLNQTKLHRILGGAHRGSSLDIVISIVTVSRNRHRIDSYEPKYLSQVLATLLKLTQEAILNDFPYSLHLEICNVDFDPATYAEAQHLSKYVTMVSRFNKTHLTFDNQLEKEKKDYVFCLNQAQKHNTRYVLLLEDDALPIPEFFTVLKHTIVAHLDKKYQRGEFRENAERVAFVKLYHPQRLIGFLSIEPERLPEWFSIAVILTMFSALIYKQIYLTDNAASKISLYFLTFAFFVYYLLVMLVIGRANLIEIRRFLPPHLYSYVPAPECCTPAMLFPQSGAETLVNYLNSVQCKAKFGKDIALEQFLHDSENPEWTAYMVQPNLVTHIGMYSSLRTAIVDPLSV